MKVAIAYMNTNTGLCGIETSYYATLNLNSINNSGMRMPQKMAAANDIILGLRGEISVTDMAYWVVTLP